MAEWSVAAGLSDDRGKRESWKTTTRANSLPIDTSPHSQLTQPRPEGMWRAPPVKETGGCRLMAGCCAQKVVVRRRPRPRITAMTMTTAAQNAPRDLEERRREEKRGEEGVRMGDEGRRRRRRRGQETSTRRKVEWRKRRCCERLKGTDARGGVGERTGRERGREIGREAGRGAAPVRPTAAYAVSYCRRDGDSSTNDARTKS